MAVADLMTQGKLGWDMTKLNELFNDATVQAIKNIPCWSLGQEDRWIWLKTNSSELTVKLAYKELTHQDSNPHASTIFGKIWQLPIHERLKMHLWCIASNLLPTKAAISRFATNIDAACCFCDHPVESVIHFFLVCPLARALWFGSEWCIKTDAVCTCPFFNQHLDGPPIKYLGSI